MEPQNSEQELCVQCGICCDNTLFDIVKLIEGEAQRFPSLPKKEVEGHEYFVLPCPHFDSCCTIYMDTPSVCKSFRCQLLKDFSDDKRTKERSLLIIKETKAFRDQIVDQYFHSTGERLSLRQIEKALEATNKENKLERNLNTLLLKVELLNIQLAKHFRSPDKYNELYKLLDE